MHDAIPRAASEGTVPLDARRCQGHSARVLPLLFASVVEGVAPPVAVAPMVLALPPLLAAPSALLQYTLAVMLALAPRATARQLLLTADAIATVADTREEAALLAVVDLYETNYGHGGRRWGLVTPQRAARLEGRPLWQHAEEARDALRVGARLCGPRWALSWFHTGECPCIRRRHCPGPTRFSEQEWRAWRKVLLRVP